MDVNADFFFNMKMSRCVSITELVAPSHERMRCETVLSALGQTSSIKAEWQDYYRFAIMYLSAATQASEASDLKTVPVST